MALRIAIANKDNPMSLTPIKIEPRQQPNTNIRTNVTLFGYASAEAAYAVAQQLDFPCTICKICAMTSDLIPLDIACWLVLPNKAIDKIL